VCGACRFCTAALRRAASSAVVRRARQCLPGASSPASLHGRFLSGARAPSTVAPWLPSGMCGTVLSLPELRSQSARRGAAHGVRRRAGTVRRCAAPCHGSNPYKRGLKCRTTESTYNTGGGAGAAVPTSFRHQRRPGPRRPAPDNPGTVVTSLPTPLATSLYAGLWAMRGASEENLGGLRSNCLPDSAVGRSVIKKPNNITDTRDTTGIIDTRGTIDVFHPAPSGVVDILDASDVRD